MSLYTINTVLTAVFHFIQLYNIIQHAFKALRMYCMLSPKCYTDIHINSGVTANVKLNI